MDEYNYTVGKPPEVIGDRYNIELRLHKKQPDANNKPLKGKPNSKPNERLQFTKSKYLLPLKYDKLRLTIKLSTKSKLYKLLSWLDDIIPQLAYENRKQWFSEDLWDNDLESFQDNYHKILQLDESTIDTDAIDDDVSSIPEHYNLGFNLFFRYNNLVTEIYDHNNTIIKDQVKIIQELGFGDYLLSGLFQINSIWFNNEAYGVSLELLQIKMLPNIINIL